MDPIEKWEFPFNGRHAVTEKEIWEEEMFLGLRKTEGVSISHFSRKIWRQVHWKLFKDEIQI